MVVVFLLAMLGFLLSVLVHGSTFLARPPLGIEQIWPLHVGIFLVFIPAVLTHRDAGGAGKRNASFRVQFPHVPRWMGALLFVCFAYAILNFLLTIVLHSGEAERAIDAELRDGRYVVLRDGAVVDEVSEREYRAARARISRAFSGHWMFFYGFAAIEMLDGWRRRRAADAARPKPPLLRPAARASAAYTLEPAPRLSPWAHSSIQILLAIFCFFAFPAAAVLPAIALQEQLAGAGCVGMVLFFPAAITGLFWPASFFRRNVPARCPACSGRTFCDRLPLDNQENRNPVTYTCRDCGHLHLLGGDR
jgi:hypothetical protein